MVLNWPAQLHFTRAGQLPATNAASNLQMAASQQSCLFSSSGSTQPQKHRHTELVARAAWRGRMSVNSSAARQTSQTEHTRHCDACLSRCLMATQVWLPLHLKCEVHSACSTQHAFTADMLQVRCTHPVLEQRIHNPQSLQHSFAALQLSPGQAAHSKWSKLDQVT